MRHEDSLHFGSHRKDSMPKEYPRPEKPSISSVREKWDLTIPKTVKSCLFFLERNANFVIFLICICFLLHKRARTANEDIQTHPHRPHSTPLQP